MLKEDLTSPTVTTESIFITSVIDAKENREVAIVDLPGAFLHTELMTMIARQTYRKYVTIENGQKVLYVKPQKALNGVLKSALLSLQPLCSKQGNKWETNDHYMAC